MLKKALMSCALALACSSAGVAAKTPPKPDCNSGCLLGVADRLLNSIAVNAPDDIPAAPDLVIRQDGQVIRAGEGLWTNAQAFTSRHTYVDPVAGQFVFYGVAYSGGIPAIVLIRGKVEAKLLSEIEILAVKRAESLSMYDLEGLELEDPLWGRPVPKASQSTREELVAIANSYFDSIEAGDPYKTTFHPDCFRSENGQWTTNNPPQYPRSCSEGIRYLGPLSKVSYRRYPLVDVERGLVLASVIFGGPGVTPEDSTFDYRGRTRFVPGSSVPPGPAFIYEIFKIEDGHIRGILAAMKDAPKGINEPWPLEK